MQELKAKLEASEVARKLAVTDALSAVEKERDTLAHELKTPDVNRRLHQNLPK